MQLRRQPKNLVEATYALARKNGLGPVKAISYSSDAITLAAALAVAHIRGVGRDGEWPNQAEYAAHYKMTERNAQREWKRFRDVYGADADPYVLARHLLSEKPSELARLAELGKPEEVLDLAMNSPATLLGPLALA
jgi:hypothetical protein